MAKKTQAYADNRGVMHPIVSAAVFADMRDIMSSHIDNAAILTSVVEGIFNDREDIERVFRDLDDLTAPEVVDAK